MEVIAGIVAALALFGACLAVYERRKGLRWHDERTPQVQSETDRAALRAEEQFRGH